MTGEKPKEGEKESAGCLRRGKVWFGKEKTGAGFISVDCSGNLSLAGCLRSALQAGDLCVCVCVCWKVIRREWHWSELSGRSWAEPSLTPLCLMGLSQQGEYTGRLAGSTQTNSWQGEDGPNPAVLSLETKERIRPSYQLPVPPNATPRWHDKLSIGNWHLLGRKTPKIKQKQRLLCLGLLRKGRHEDLSGKINPHPTLHFQTNWK